MIRIDGAQKSGSGTLVRLAVSIASLLGESIEVYNIRAGRKRPGLRPQHLASVKACAEMCGAAVEGAEVNSMVVRFQAGRSIKGGCRRWDIGTAGSTTLLAYTLLPLMLFSGKDGLISLTGGLFQDFAPSAHHMQHVLLPTLSKMGIRATLGIIRPGYVPRGGGTIEIKTHAIDGSLEPLCLIAQGETRTIRGIALSSRLRKQRVSDRMAEECERGLAAQGFKAQIQRAYDESAFQAGASLAVWAETDSGCILGSDQAGKLGRRSESIGKYVAASLLEDLGSGAAVDRHLADQLVMYGALASGTTEYLIPRCTDHVDASLWLVEKFGAKAGLRENKVTIKGIGYTPATP